MKNQTIIMFLIMAMVLVGCNKDDKSKPELPDISVIEISQESDWNYCVIGKSDYYYIRDNGTTPDAVFFHSSEANKDYSINFTADGTIDKVMVDDYIFSFKNPDGNKIDIGVLYADGTIEILRGVETDYDWDSYSLQNTKSIEAWSDVIRWTGRVVAGVPCGITASAAVSTGGIATPIAVWACGNYVLSLSADIAENELEIHNGFTEFVNVYGNTQTAISCASGDLLDCLSDAASRSFSQWAAYQEELERRQDDLHLMESALGYGHGDVQITLTWDNTADLDLHVIDPNNEEIYWSHSYSASGGALDVDDIDGYGPENIFWLSNTAPSGTYKVYVHHYVWSQADYPQTANFTVLVNAFGNSEKFTGTTSLDETVYIANFDHNGLITKDSENTFSITISKK